MAELSNGGIARISENRCVGWKAPETYISQFYGTDGGYEFAVANHYLAHWDSENPGKVVMRDVTKSLLPVGVYERLQSNREAALQEIADGAGFFDSSPIQPIQRLPKEFDGMPNGHNGTHLFLVDDFCRAYDTGKLSPTNIWQVARYNIPGLVAHQSALSGGKVMDVPNLGNPPEDWEVLSDEVLT